MRKVSTILVICFSVLLFSSSTWAQAEKQDVQRFFVEEIVLELSGIGAYESAVKEFAAVFAKHEFPYPMTVFSREDGHYFISYPVADFTGIDQLYSIFNELLGKWGEEKYEALHKRIEDAVKYVNYAVIRLVPEMSYVPEVPTLDPEEAHFRYWGMCYVKYGKEKKVAENFEKIAEIFKKKKIPMGFETYQIEFGNDTPVYFYAEIGESASEFWASADKAGEMMGEEVMEIWNETMTYFRKYEPTFGLYRPDLSYIPKEK